VHKNKRHSQEYGKLLEPDKPPPELTSKQKLTASVSTSMTGNSKKPVLVLTGIAAVAVVAIVWGMLDDTPDDPVVDVERAQYATQEACVADWNDPADCQQVFDEGGDGSMSAASLDAIAAASDAAMIASSAPDASVSNGSAGGAHVGSHGGGWYGPYYTRSGVIYHSSGIQTTGGVPAAMHGEATNLAMRSTSLSSGSSAFVHTPRAVSLSESRAISRGGFTSGHGGEGGGHGFGGSRGG
jgi:hypothetical protein